jgi:hypothetical protein
MWLQPRHAYRCSVCHFRFQTSAIETALKYLNGAVWDVEERSWRRKLSCDACDHEFPGLKISAPGQVLKFKLRRDDLTAYAYGHEVRKFGRQLRQMYERKS